MLPVLFSIGPIKIYTFGVFLVLSFFWGSFLLWRLIKLTAYKEEVIFDGVFISLAVALFFARLFYVLAHFSEFGFSFLRFILINGYPGLSIYGGILGATLAIVLFFRIKKIKVFAAIDYFISPLFVALAIGFLGKFFSYYQSNSTLFQSFLFFLLSFFSYRILFLIRQEKLFSGFNFLFFINTFSFSRLFFEKGLIQKILLLLFLTTLIFFLYYFRTALLAKINNLIKIIKSYGKKIFKKRTGAYRSATSSKKERSGTKD